MIGIEFKCSSGSEMLPLIGGLVSMLDEGLRCYISNDDVYLYTKEAGELEFTPYRLDQIYTPKKLVSVLLGNRINVMSFIEIFCSHKADEQEQIETYDDFLKSNCQAIILVSDDDFAEMYAKDQLLLKQWAEFLKESHIEVVEKTLENDGRTRMSVW